MNNDDIVSKFVNTYKSENSRKMVISSLNTFTEFYTGNLLEINKRVIMDYFTELNNNDSYTLQTKKNKFTILRTFVNWINDYFDDRVNIKLPHKSNITWSKVGHKEPENNNHILTPEQVEIILNHLKYRNRKMFLVFSIFATSGMRKTELINIKTSDVHLKKRYIKTTGKTGVKEYIIDPRLANNLESFIIERKKIPTEHKNLFLSSQLKPYSARSFNKYLKKILNVLNIEYFSVQHFRKSLNTNRKRLKQCPNEIAELLLGHSPSATNIKYYTEYSIDDKRELFDKYNPYQDIKF